MVFPPAFLDSSSCWNTNHNHLQLQQIGSNTHITSGPSPAGPGDGGRNNNNQEGLMATAAAGGGGGNGGGGGAGDGYGGGGENSEPMSMWERARLARMPQPESGLNCPRCDSTNTKFCYFNNYSLTQPRHLCHACRRYWTRGGALRNVPVGGRSRRHAKRSAKPKAPSAASGAGARTSSTMATMPSTTASTTDTATTSPTLQYSMFSSSPPQGRSADNFNPVSDDLSLPTRLLFANGGMHHHHHQGNVNSMDQWEAAQMQSFPFVHAMDHQMAGPPAAAMPITMAAIQGKFHLGLQSGGGSNGKDDGGGAYAADGGVHHHHHVGDGNGMEQWAVAQMQNLPFLHAMDHHMGEPLAAAMPTTMAAMQGMFHLGQQSGGNGDDGGDHQFHQQQQDYTSRKGIYGDIVNVNGGGSYNFYSSNSNAAGN